jgi:O-antigen ligase
LRRDAGAISQVEEPWNMQRAWPIAASGLPITTVAAGVYLVASNHLPEGIKSALAGLIGLAVLTLLFGRAGTSAAARAGLVAVLVIAGLAAVAYAGDWATAARSGPQYAALTLRSTTAIAALALFVSAPGIVHPRLLFGLYAGVVLAALAAFGTDGFRIVAGILRPASFTGGEDGIHSSAYVLAGAFLGTLTLRRAGYLAASATFLLALPLGLLLLGFQVRTTWLMVLVYVTAVAVEQVRPRDRPLALLGIVVAASAALLAIVTVDLGPEAGLSEFSSGRTANYNERMAILLSRPALEFLVGTGPGSELLMTRTWWWEAKNSHNDFLDILFQSGLAGLLALLLLCVVAILRAGPLHRPLVLAFLASSLLSNGLLSRPVIAVFYLAVLAAGFARAPVRSARVTTTRVRYLRRSGAPQAAPDAEPRPR